MSYLDISENTIGKDNLYVYCNSNPVNNIDPKGNLILFIWTKVSWSKSNKKRKSAHFTKVMSNWYKSSDFETITLNSGYSISATVSGSFGVSAKTVSAKVGLSNSYTISLSASGTHKVNKEKGKNRCL